MRAAWLARIPNIRNQLLKHQHRGPLVFDAFPIHALEAARRPIRPQGDGPLMKLATTKPLGRAQRAGESVLDAIVIVGVQAMHIVRLASSTNRSPAT